MGSLFSRPAQPNNNELKDQSQALYQAREDALTNQALANQQNNYQQVSRLGRRRTSGGNTPAIASGGFFGAGGRQGSTGADRRNTFLGG